MRKKWITYLVLVCLITTTFAQNNQILYGFDEIPQTLLLNPGAEVSYDKHFGVPFLSNISFQGGVTNKNITYNSVVADAAGFNTLLENIYSQNLENNDYFIANQRWEILNAGMRLKDPSYYLSFGIYEEIQGFSSYDKEMARLFLYGDYDNAENLIINQNTSFTPLNFIGELVGVFHIGLTKQINKKWNVGARLKILSGSLDVRSLDNSGIYNLTQTDDGLYNHNFQKMGFIIQNSGLFNELNQDVTADFGQAFKGLFFMEGNIGFGLDLGFTHHINEKISISGSLLDLDYLAYSGNTVSYEVTDDFTIDNNSPFEPPIGSQKSYWLDLLEDYQSYSENGYNSTRGPKLNAAVSYKFMNRKKGDDYVFRNVNSIAYAGKEFLVSELGLQTYTVFYPSQTHWAVTAFYSREINKYLATKVTYTYDKFSPTNFGLGISTHFNRFNFYATADNLLDLPNWKNSNYQSFQFGMNFIFN